MKWMLPAIFCMVFVGHFLYTTRGLSGTANDGTWAVYEYDRPIDSRLVRYIKPGEYWLGFSFSLAGTFAAFCFIRILKMRREAWAASTGGLTLSGVLWAAICFLTGCCGSPMLPLYLGLFGPKFLNATKPLTFGVTLLSIVAGYVWMIKRAPKTLG